MAALDEVDEVDERVGERGGGGTRGFGFEASLAVERDVVDCVAARLDVKAELLGGCSDVSSSKLVVDVAAVFSVLGLSSG